MKIAQIKNGGIVFKEILQGPPKMEKCCICGGHFNIITTGRYWPFNGIFKPICSGCFEDKVDK